jgi:hypothetical protein
MDTVELRAASERLARLHGRFVPCFGRRECQEHALGYLRGLLLGTGRKSVEPMALVFGGSSPDQPEIEQSVALAWQRFLTVSPWEANPSYAVARENSRILAGLLTQVQWRWRFLRGKAL